MISFKKVWKKLSGETVLGGISFSLAADGVYCITGPSGCGKTTTLRILAGLEQPDSGEVILPQDRQVSFSFQEPGLLPWKTAEENITFVLRDLMSPGRCLKTAGEYLNLMGLWKYKDYYPAAMSGGMRQRVGLCRAFAYPHRLLLLDEPFKSLDLPLKLTLLKDVLKIWSLAPRTVVWVTHDIAEAALMAHRVLVFSAKPAVVKSQLAIDLPPRERNLGDSRVARLISDILEIMEGEAKLEKGMGESDEKYQRD